MKKVILIAFILFLSSAFADDGQTFYEKSNFKETPRYAQTIAFCKQMAAASPKITYLSYGFSPQGRELPLLIVDKDGLSNARDVRATGRAVFLIQAGIHAGEIDGKDAGFMLIRDMVLRHKQEALLDDVTLLFMPIFNVDGHEHFGPYNRINQNGPAEMGWRVTAQNYNLNRDYLKADSPEMQAWLRLYQRWLPEFFADCHVTDGADYQYAVTYDIDAHGVMAPNLNNWVKNDYLPSMLQKMKMRGTPTITYIFPVKRHDPKSGLASWVATPRFSNGYTAINNRPGLLVETHMLKDYKTRVTATYNILLSSLEILAAQRAPLQEKIREADHETASASFLDKPLVLTYQSTGKADTLDFLGIAYNKKKSAITGKMYISFGTEKETWKVPFFDYFKPKDVVKLPAAYIIPVEWTEVIRRIQMHGIHYNTLRKALNIPVDSYRFSDVHWAEKPFENHHMLTRFTQRPIHEKRIYPAGSIIIPVAQPRAKIIAHILEPKAPDSYLRWGYFDPIFEQKEYAESYVMEAMAPLMLLSNPQLKKDYEQKMKSDSSFANNPQKILFWFYQNSPYWDKRINRYPVGKIKASDMARVLENAY